MGIHSGKYGVVDGVSTVKNWQINETSDVKSFVASNTNGGTGRRRGNHDWTGSYVQYGCRPDHMPGETFNFKGYTSPDDDVSGNGAVYIGDAIVDSIAITWNWENAEITSTTVNFASAGPLTRGSDEFTDTSDILAESPIGGQVRISGVDGSSFAELCPVASATLTISAANKTYNNSCTNGATGRKPGTLDWTLALVIQETDLDDLPFDIDDFVGIQIDDGDTGDFWELLYGIVKDFSGFSVDRESSAIIQVTANIEMSVDDHAGNPGAITLPGAGSPWWELSP